MKKFGAVLLCTLLSLTSCQSQVSEEDEVVQDEEETSEKQEKSIVPDDPLSEDKYKMILPYKTSAARGVITEQVENRLDIDEMEEGLRRQSKTVFDPEEYYFQEGQYLEEDIVKELIDDLNPEKPDEDMSEKEEKKHKKKHPRYLSHIQEQNYLTKNDDDNAKLEGISIGLAMKSSYERDISKDEMMKQGKKIAEEVLDEIRDNDEADDVPVMIAIYREEDEGSPVPGNFVAKTKIDKGESSIGDWSNVKEDNALFPDDEAPDKYHDDNKLVEEFDKEIQEFFPNYVGVIGRGFYIDEDLQKLTMEIPIDFYGKGEVIGFTQYANGLIKEIFPDYYDIELEVTESNETESVIYREAGESDPIVHIFD